MATKVLTAAASGNIVRPLKPERLSKFVDSVRVKFQGGRGGDGCISMLSLYANEFAGPAGGNGGCGGHIVLKASKEVKSLNNIATTYKGLPGVRGQGKNLFGANAEHTFVHVPVGTLVTPAAPKELPEHEIDPDKSEIVAFLDRHDSMFIAARGGAGGKGNNYYLSNTNRHPRIAQAGAEGELNVYELRMRIFAHVGLIGLPNVGKSTLLRTLTSANVKIGDYAFTTLHPQVGTIEYDDYTQVAISDLPGLIEDSHKNRGLGVRFLRNVHKCVCLLYVIDMTKDPIEQFELLVNELEMHRKGLSEKPHLVLGNKIDHPDSNGKEEPFRDYLARHKLKSKLITSSAKRGDNLEELKAEFRIMYDAYQAKHVDEPEDALIW